MIMTEKRKMGRINFVLNTIKKNPDSSKSEIKKLSGLSMEVVLNYIDYLTKEGLIYQSKERGDKIGRKAECYRINPQGAMFIGIKFIARKFQGVLMNFAGEILKTYEKNYSGKTMTREQLFERIDDCITGLLGKSSLTGITAMGISAPGLVNFDEGILKKYQGMADTEEIPVREILENKYGINVYVCGTTKAKAISYQLTKSDGEGDYAYVFIGDGCSSALMYEDKLFCGVESFDGELGYIRLGCGAEKTEYLKDVIGNGAIVEKMQKNGFAGLSDIADVVELANQENGQACLVLKNAAEALAYALSMIMLIHAPKEIIICGDYVTVPSFKADLLKFLKTYCMKEIQDRVLLKFIKNEKSDNAFDAAQLCFYKQFYNMKLT